MKTISKLIICLILGCNTISCAYTNIKLPLDSELNKTQLGHKIGKASNYSIFWLAAWGDASYANAAKDGKITTMYHADQEITQYFFGIYFKQTTIVYGD